MSQRQPTMVGRSSSESDCARHVEKVTTPRALCHLVSLNSIDAEAIFGRARKAFAWTQDRAWKGQLVRRIRKVLRFKAETRVAAINLTGRPAQRSIKMVAAVKLKSWLRGVHFENTSAARIACTGG